MTSPATDQIQGLRTAAREIRKRALAMVARAKSCHLGSSFSCADILAVLYFHTLRLDPRNPSWPGRDRFIMSKGHAVSVLYAALAQRGFTHNAMLETYIQDGSSLGGHVMREAMPGIEASTGSLGHGLSIAVGMALALKRDHNDARVFVLLSDGECDEGSTWEGAMSAGNFALDNLVAIVDYNKIQSFGTVKEVMDLEPFADKWRAFKFHVREVDGHDIHALTAAFAEVPFKPRMPTLIIAHTIKGKGVSFMENRMEWHYHTPNDEQVAIAMQELDTNTSL